MWLNSMQREEPYLALTCSGPGAKSPFSSELLHRCCMAVVSSCREMLGLVPQRPQPPCSVATRMRIRSTLDRLPGFNQEEGGDDVKSVWPLRPGLHTCYNAQHNGMQHREVEQIHKTGPSSDWSLQLDSMKLESLVMAYQQRRREYVPGPCTHRPSHHESRFCPKYVSYPSGGSVLRQGW